VIEAPTPIVCDMFSRLHRKYSIHLLTRKTVAVPFSSSIDIGPLPFASAIKLAKFGAILDIDPLVPVTDLVCLIPFVVKYRHDIAIRKCERECPIRISMYRDHRFTY
jgi:hypothetical protein